MPAHRLNNKASPRFPPLRQDKKSGPMTDPPPRLDRMLRHSYNEKHPLPGACRVRTGS